MIDKAAFEAWCKDNPPRYSRRAEMFEAWQAGALAERKRCAKVCEAISDIAYDFHSGRTKIPTERGLSPGHSYLEGEADGANACADAISKGS